MDLSLIFENVSNATQPQINAGENEQSRVFSSYRDCKIITGLVEPFEEFKEGSNGIVYKCFSTELKTFVAVKKEKSYEREKNAKVERELKKLAKLKHENIVSLIGYLVEKDYIDGIVMELCECSLKDFMKSLKDANSKEFFTYRACVVCFLQIALGMEKAYMEVIKFIMTKFDVPYF